ncbi:hypothetical protein PIB30_035496 [Stylosanthes scabra]|uniref:Uncharacterized protein n=1 Tax=Stylosanthes scabra TaxID=79078 RepID=A0ABU6XD98_9FABA|nr:hypothetical protein [Stylosanthes scabra]
MPSMFVDVQGVRRLGDPSLWVKSGKNVAVEFLPCSPSERFYHKGQTPEWFFMYTYVLSEVGRVIVGAVLFFQAKGVGRGIWVTLSSLQGRTVFSLFKASYKDFKVFYVKGGKILTTSELLKWDSNRGAVIKYLDQGSILKYDWVEVFFFKQRAEKEVSTSHVIKTEQGSEVNKPSERRKQISMKRMRNEEASGKKVIDLTEERCCGKEVSLENTAKFTKSQKDLHGFEGAEDLSSVWREHFPLIVIADEHFHSKVDLDLLGKARMEMRALEKEAFQKKKVDSFLKSMELEKKLKMDAEQIDQ